MPGPRRIRFLPGLVGIGLLAVSSMTVAQPPGTNYDESKVPSYTLPDPLALKDGTKVAEKSAWYHGRRGELFKLIESRMYGKAPGRPEGMTFEVMSEDTKALGGKATRREVAVLFAGKPDGPRMDLLVYLPNDKPTPVPVFLGLNFGGNHTLSADPDVKLSRQWMRENKEKGIVGNRATEASRGSDALAWPVERIIDRGYGLATAYYGDIDPDFDDGFQNGVHPLFYKDGQTRPAADEWGSIAAWAWGLSRGLDYLATVKQVDAKRVAVMGHSRLGKTSLWAGVTDPRFALVVSNNSGEGGAALSRRKFGETVANLNKSFPHWFCANYRQYSEKEDAMPWDQHEVIALIAPRPVLVCSAEDDQWADPKGEFLACKGASPVYQLVGTDGLAAESFPALNHLIDSTVGYHIRPGKHAVLPADWEVYLDFADKHMHP